jgi:hypothetical protein
VDFDGQHFHNLTAYQPHNFSDILSWKLHSKKVLWPKTINNTATPDVSAVTGDVVKVTFINHASDEGIDQPIDDLKQALKISHIATDDFITLQFGESKNF